MSGRRQKIQYSLALEPAHPGETPVGGCQGTEPVVAKPAPQSPALAPSVGGAAPRGAPYPDHRRILLVAAGSSEGPLTEPKGGRSTSAAGTGALVWRSPLARGLPLLLAR
jgi:hypothetical protein